MKSFARWLPVHKPAAHTSHDVVAIARKRLNFRKIGHTGTLDPDVTGVVVLALGKATKLIQYLPGTKSYHAWIRLGLTTDTLDSSGQILSEAPVPDLSVTDIETALQSFQGIISQQPPMVSAVSYQGKRLHQLARQGIDIPNRPSREVEIIQLELCQWQSPVLEIKVTCSSGTYIRTLAHDLGQNLGCGAVLDRMERTMANGCLLSQCVDLKTLEPLMIQPEPGLPADALLQHLPEVHLDSEEALLHLYQGKILTHEDILTSSSEYVRVYDLQERLVSVACLRPEGLKSKLWLLGGPPEL